ncbi:MAG: acetyl-CoA carboxylase biotin carboxylase subunit, partial [Candidatus Omnitrophica bacterium]|nr:acetyl-CoA carboxylase biotin carboxylase subunit [Candidatus Omnitrophota bacterium]
IKIANGSKLTLKQDEIEFNGCAMECRINAEDPDKEFMPSPGKVLDYIAPGGPGIRLDTHVYHGYEVSPYYDSMLGKLIVHGKKRTEVIDRMLRALGEYVIGPIKTTIPFHKEVLNNPRFRRGQVTTDFVDTLFAEK